MADEEVQVYWTGPDFSDPALPRGQYGMVPGHPNGDHLAPRSAARDLVAAYPDYYTLTKPSGKAKAIKQPTQEERDAERERQIAAQQKKPAQTPVAESPVVPAPAETRRKE